MKRHLVFQNIDKGIMVKLFKDNERGDYGRYVIKNKKSIIFTVDNIEVPDNLTAKGLLDFTSAIDTNSNNVTMGYELN